VALASGCAVDAVESEELLGTEEQGAQVCNNDQATNALIASMAVVMAREVGRWDAEQDLTTTWVWRSATNQWVEIVALTQTAKNRCSARGYGQCYDLQNLFNLQVNGSGMQFGGAQLTDVNVLSSRMISYYRDQRTCIDDTNNNGDRGQSNQCPGESNELNYYRTSTSWMTCVTGKDYWYKATYPAGHYQQFQPLNATDAAQLRNQLKWAGGTQNPYLAFETDPNVAGDVKIDPLEGATGGSSSSSGSCEVAMNPVPYGTDFKCDNTNVAKPAGSCCTCGTATLKTWKPALMAGWYKCTL
jgi:hypothetical protein